MNQVVMMMMRVPVLCRKAEIRASCCHKPVQSETMRSVGLQAQIWTKGDRKKLEKKTDVIAAAGRSIAAVGSECGGASGRARTRLSSGVGLPISGGWSLLLHARFSPLLLAPPGVHEKLLELVQSRGA